MVFFYFYRDIFRLTMSNYQTWFETSVIFWLQTFKEECTQRMEKALEIDKDVVRVTSLVKYSNSSVDVLTNFSKVSPVHVEGPLHKASQAKYNYLQLELEPIIARI